MAEINLNWGALYRTIQESGLTPVDFAHKVGVAPLRIGMVRAGKPVPEQCWRKLMMEINHWETWRGVRRA